MASGREEANSSRLWPAGTARGGGCASPGPGDALEGRGAAGQSVPARAQSTDDGSFHLFTRRQLAE